MLEAKGFIGRLILIDGAPQHLKILIHQHLHSSSQEELENNILLSVMNAYVAVNCSELKLELRKCNTWDEKVNAFFNVLSPEYRNLFLKGHQKKAILLLHGRFQSIIAYNPKPMPYVKTPITLFKPLFPSVQNAPYDYGLQNITEAKVDVHTVEGTWKFKCDLRCLSWIEVPIITDYQNEDLVSIYYASLNFKDVM
uniref:uncharacterized protein LOC127062552 isoform X1 n=1 Tax=Vespula vulgaris TaxID=7454 RepID=UPI00223C25B7|nr:uncharacterized protein LOC127062552 isoform X1 [Vespula vulgaris]